MVLADGRVSEGRSKPLSLWSANERTRPWTQDQLHAQNASIFAFWKKESKKLIRVENFGWIEFLKPIFLRFVNLASKILMKARMWEI